MHLCNIKTLPVFVEIQVTMHVFNQASMMKLLILIYKSCDSIMKAVAKYHEC